MVVSTMEFRQSDVCTGRFVPTATGNYTYMKKLMSLLCLESLHESLNCGPRGYYVNVLFLMMKSP